MRGKTACENCGSSSDFLKDSAGFYVCLECGQQQQDYREEYRDEFDVLFETTGQHVNDLGDVRNLSRSQKSVAAFTEGDGRRRRACSLDENDYDPAVEEGVFDPEWKEKAPSEGDFFRALQTILMYCIRNLVENMGFPPALDAECRRIWFLVMKTLVETDYPVQTYFSDLNTRRHKIGIRRMYTPKVADLDPSLILENTSIPISVRAVVRHLGTNRMDYVKGIAPFYNCSGSRRRGPAPEIVKLRQERVQTKPRVPLPLPEAQPTTQQGSDYHGMNVPPDTDVVSDDHAANQDIEAQHAIRQSCAVKNLGGDHLFDEALEPLLGAPSFDFEAEQNGLFASPSSKTKCFSVTHRQKNQPVNSMQQTPSALPLVDSQQHDAVSVESSNPFCHVSQFFALRPKRTVRERQKEACIVAGIEPPKSSGNLPATRTSLPRYRVPRHMRAAPNNKHFKYPDDNKEPTVLGFPQSLLKVMLRERLLSSGAKCNPYNRAISKRKNARQNDSEKVTVVPDLRWQIDQIYEHDFLVHLLEMRKMFDDASFTHSELDGEESGSSCGAVLSSAAASAKWHRETISKKPVDTAFGSKQTVEQEAETNVVTSQPAAAKDDVFQCLDLNQLSKSDLLRWVDDVLKKEWTASEARKLVSVDPDVQLALRSWQTRGLVLLSLSHKTDSDQLDTDVALENGGEFMLPQDIQTTTAAHRRFFQRKPMRHELSATAMIERILRHWMRSSTSTTDGKNATTNISLKLLQLCSLYDDQEKSQDVPLKLSSSTPSPLEASPTVNPTLVTEKNDAGESELLEYPNKLAAGSANNNVLVAPLARSYVELIKNSLPETENIDDAVAQRPVSRDSLGYALTTEQPDNAQTHSVVPLKRLDPFYHQDDWCSSAVATPVQRLVEWRRLLNKCYSKFQNERGGLQSFAIFDKLALNPTVSMSGCRLLQNDEIIELLKLYYVKTRDVTQIKFLPILKYLLSTSTVSHRQMIRSVGVREAFSLLTPPYLHKARLYRDEEEFAEPPRIDHVFVLTVLWMGFLNLRYAVTSSDICRWVESGAIPFNTALSEIPIWLFEASGVCDKYSKFSAFPSVLRQDMIFRDRSVIQVAEPVRPDDLEETLINLKLQGIPLAPFCARSLLPRLLHHCKLPTYIQPLAMSLLNVIEFPLTAYQDGYAFMSKQSDSIGDQIYGYIGPFPSLRTVAAAVLIVCRLLWPIFVYQPLGLPGIADAPCKKSPLTYSPAALRYNDDAKQNRPILYYELRLSRWVATISSALSESAEDSCNAPHDNAVVQQYFDTSNVGFLDAGIAALEWVRKNSPSAFASLSSKFAHYESQLPTRYSEFQTLHKTDRAAPTELDFLFVEFCTRGHRDFAFRLSEQNGSRRDAQSDTMPDAFLYPPVHRIMPWLPTNQEMFYKLVSNANTPGWLDSLQPWTFLNDAWQDASDLEKQVMLTQLGHWLYRPTLDQGRWKDAAASLVGSDPANQNFSLTCPSEVSVEIEAFLNENTDHLCSPEPTRGFTAKETSSPINRDVVTDGSALNDNASRNSEHLAMPCSEDPMASVENFLIILYRVYLKSVLNTFQEPPMPTKCFHPVDVTYKSAVNDSPLDEIRFPVPYALLLRRVSSFIHTNHLVVHAAASKLECWLFVSEVPERFRHQEEATWVQSADQS